MAEIRDWEHHRQMSIRLLEKRTGEGLAVWNARVAKVSFEASSEVDTAAIALFREAYEENA